MTAPAIHALLELFSEVRGESVGEDEAEVSNEEELMVEVSLFTVIFTVVRN